MDTIVAYKSRGKHIHMYMIKEIWYTTCNVEPKRESFLDSFILIKNEYKILI
jgi:hypothetical protein